MTYRPTLKAERALQAIAEGQSGLFTSKQAASAGYGSSHLAYHVRTGWVKREGHGIYRLTTVPMGDHDDLVELSLWSRNRADEPQSVISHVTALVVHKITDLLPSKLHITVPLRFKKRPPAGCVLHRAVLARGDWEQRVGFRVTVPLRTLLDAADALDVPTFEFDNSVHRALEVGLVRKDQLVEAVESGRVDDRLREALEFIERNAG